MRFEPPISAELLSGTFARLASEGRERFSVWRRNRVGMRGLLLYVLVLPILIAILVHAALGQVGPLLYGIAAGALILSSARLNRLAIQENLSRAKRRFTKGGQRPYRWLAIASLAGFTGLAAWGLAEHSLLSAAVYAVLSAFGFHLAYPNDGAVPPESSGSDSKLSQASLASLQKAEERLINLRKLGQKIGQSELASRLESIADTGSQILAQLADQPELIARSRRFLHVYLEGAERVATHYARAHRNFRHEQLENRFRQTLVLIEQSVRKHKADLARKHIEPLDIQIAVLQRQLRDQAIR